MNEGPPQSHQEDAERHREEVLKTIDALKERADTDIERLREEVRAEEEANIAAYETHRGGRPRAIEGRELGAKIGLAAAEKAADLLSFAIRGVTERPTVQQHRRKLTLLDIGSGRRNTDRIGDTVTIGMDGTEGLESYFDEGKRLKERTLEYQKNPYMMEQVVKYFYDDQRRVVHPDASIQDRALGELSSLKKGDSARHEATDIDNVYIEYERAKIEKEGSPYGEERLQMSVVVDDLK